MRLPAVSVDFIRDVAVLTLRNPPVNGLSKALRTGIIAGLDKAHGEFGVQAVVIVGSGRGFCGGADIKEFQTGGHLVSPTLSEVGLELTKR